jgi:hypothetical protein
MSFSPDINVSIVNKCKKMTIEDNSDLGADGWYDGSTGLDNTTVTGATLTFMTAPTGATYTSPIDVTSTVTGADPLYGDFTLTGASGTYPDGLYRIKYEVNAGGQSYSTTLEFWGYCNAEHGRDKMFAKYSSMLEDDAKDRYLDDANDVDKYLTSIKSAIASVNINSLTYQQKVIDKILDFNNVPKAY